jgi:beta-lactamase class A
MSKLIFKLKRRYVAVTFFILGLVMAMAILGSNILPNFLPANQENAVGKTSPASANSFEIKRLDWYKNIKPVISLEPRQESEGMKAKKEALQTLIEELKKQGLASQISVYFRNASTAEWLSINGDVKYHPASLMKVPLMLAILKMAEENPSLLKQSIEFHPDPVVPFEEQFFKDKTLEAGKTYTVHDLIFYAIAYSDNFATQVLSKHVDAAKARSLFQALGLPVPEPNNPAFLLTADEYSMFIKSIFNSTFLSPEYSEYGAEMMVNCNFKQGFAKGFPTGTKMWHKYGEWSSPGVDAELHESGVVFIKGNPYVLTVMTRGKDQNKLAEAIQKIAANLESSHLP